MSSAFERLQKIAEEKRLKQKLEIVPKSDPTLPHPSTANNTIPGSTLPDPTIDHPSIKNKISNVSPTRDFTKFSNSIIKQAVPNGLFRGQSKHTYDVLYQKTRGAIMPKREVQLTKTELVKLTGLEIKTIQRHLSFLKTAGLITVDTKVGDHKGAIYTVLIPEELTLPYPSAVEGRMVEYSLDERSMNSPLNPSIDNTTLGFSKIVENKTTYEMPKTSFKDNVKNDDEPFGMMLSELERIGKGKPEDWKSLAELLRMEFEVAAARTKSVTNAPAFLTEHLRRRLIGKSETPKPKANKLSQVGKQQPIEQTEAYQPEPLTEEGRESTLKTFIGYIEKGQKEFLMSLQDTYTKEDWDFLMKEIKGK
jgi:hypothetical protein